MRSFKLTVIVLAGSFLTWSAVAQGASASIGKFTLPVETKWGLAVLPAGEYTYKLDKAALSGVLTLKGQGKTAMIMVNAGISERPISDRSSLTLIRNGNQAAVQSLNIGHLGTVFYYRLPKSIKVLEAKNPQIQRVPVAVAHK